MLISLPQLIIQSWHLYRRHFSALRPYMLLIFIPTFILSLAGMGGIVLTALLPASEGIVGIIIILLIIAGSLFSVLANTSVLLAFKQSVDQGTIPAWKETLSKVWPCLLPIIWVSLLVTLIFLGGLILFIIPALIFSIWYAFSTYQVLFEGARGWAALQASKKMVKGRWFAIAWRLVAPGVIFGLLIAVTSFLVNIPFSTLGPALSDTGFNLNMFGLAVVRGLLSALISAILSPLATLPPLLLYLEAKKTPIAVTSPATVV